MANSFELEFRVRKPIREAVPAPQSLDEAELLDLITNVQSAIGKHLRKHGGNALESSGRSFGLLTRLAGMVEDAVGPELVEQAGEQSPLYRYNCPDGHRWLFLAEYTECPFCGMAGARGEVWDGTWPKKEG